MLICRKKGLNAKLLFCLQTFIACQSDYKRQRYSKLTAGNEKLTGGNEKLTGRNEKLTGRNEKLTGRNEKLTGGIEEKT